MNWFIHVFVPYYLLWGVSFEMLCIILELIIRHMRKYPIRPYEVQVFQTLIHIVLWPLSGYYFLKALIDWNLDDYLGIEAPKEIFPREKILERIKGHEKEEAIIAGTFPYQLLLRSVALNGDPDFAKLIISFYIQEDEPKIIMTHVIIHVKDMFLILRHSKNEDSNEVWEISDNLKDAIKACSFDYPWLERDL